MLVPSSSRAERGTWAAEGALLEPPGPSSSLADARDDVPMNAKASCRSFENSSGPRAQYSRDESPDQCSHSPASFVTLATGIDLMSGPISTVLPVRTNGAM